ncbi:MAG: type IV toxin-antitoxin system AbiEi family antitoxin domain-containing protein [Actinomycetota bacterium]
METHRAIARILARQHGLITRKQALHVGLSPRSIYQRLETGSWERAQRGVYRLAAAPGSWHQHVLAACLAAGPSAVASHRSAAALWDFSGRHSSRADDPGNETYLDPRSHRSPRSSPGQRGRSAAPGHSGDQPGPDGG